MLSDYSLNLTCSNFLVIKVVKHNYIIIIIIIM